MKRQYGKHLSISILFLSLLFLLFSNSCKKAEENVAPTGGPVSIYVVDTFDNSSLCNIPVELDYNGQRIESVTDGSGFIRFEDIQPGNYTIKVNFSNSKAGTDNNYIPSVYDVALIGGEEIQYDIVKKADLNPNGYSWLELLKAYRGGLSNSVWASQPKQWIVYDPHGYLNQYSDKRNNPIFNNIMKGFKAIEEYSNGFLKAPSRDSVGIVNSTDWADNKIYFEITDGRAYEADKENSNGEIIRSVAGTRGRSANGAAGELVASVQGGDNEGVPSVFDGNPMNDLDRRWGDFNYNRRISNDSFKLNVEGYNIIEIRVKLK